eukprot:GSA120T00006210001.1
MKSGAAREGDRRPPPSGNKSRKIEKILSVDHGVVPTSSTVGPPVVTSSAQAEDPSTRRPEDVVAPQQKNYAHPCVKNQNYVGQHKSLVLERPAEDKVLYYRPSSKRA